MDREGPPVPKPSKLATRRGFIAAGAITGLAAAIGIKISLPNQSPPATPPVESPEPLSTAEATPTLVKTPSPVSIDTATAPPDASPTKPPENFTPTATSTPSFAEQVANVSHGGATDEQLTALAAPKDNTPTAGATPDTLQSTYNPDQDSKNLLDSLNATATRVNELHKEYNFTPEGKYTESFFQEVRESTFILLINGIFYGTAWKAGENNGNPVYAMCRHQLEAAGAKVSESDVNGIQIIRPGTNPIDDQPTSFRFAYNEKEDIALIEWKEKSFEPVKVKSLNTQDNYIPKNGEDFLRAGFSYEFVGFNPISKSIIDGSVIRYSPPAGSSNNNPQQEWFAFSNIDGGASGSPVCRIGPDGRPQVVGIVANKGYKSSSQGNLDSYLSVGVIPLNIQELMPTLSSKKWINQRFYFTNN